MESVRPQGVPTEAIWNKEDKLWQFGAFSTNFKKKQVPSGRWQYWSENGTLVCIAHFDEDGRYDGSIECFHPDGSLASRGFWKSGSRCGHFVFIRTEGETSQAYPASYQTWRYEFDSNANWEERDEHWYLKDGTECTSDGRPLTEAFDLDQFFLQAEPENFIHDKLSEFVMLYEPSRSAQAANLGEKERLSQNLMEVWGLAPTSLVEMLYWFGQIEAADALQTNGPATVRSFEGNIWKSLITNPFENINEEIAAVFMGAVKLGRLGDSDGVWGTLFSQVSGLPGEAIYQWSHDTYCIDDVLALSYDDFAYQVALCQSSLSERISPACEQQTWPKLAGRVAIPYHLSGRITDSEQIDFEGARLDGNELYRRNFWRSYWIIELLKAPSYFEVSQFKDSLSPGCFDINGGESSFAEGLARGLQVPPLAVNILFTLFFLSEDEKLKEAAAVFQGSGAKIVRDLVDLLLEVSEGLVLDAYGEKIDLLERRQLISKLDLVEKQVTVEMCEEGGSKDPLADLSALNRQVLSYFLEQGQNAGHAQQRILFQEALWFLQERDSKTIEELERALLRFLEQGKPGPLELCFAVSDRGCLSPSPYIQAAVRDYFSLANEDDEYFIRRSIACIVTAAARDPFLLNYASRLIRQIESDCAKLRDFEARMALSSYDQILKEIMRGIRYVLPFLDQNQIEESGLRCESLLDLHRLYLKNYSFDNAAELLKTLLSLKVDADLVLPLICGLLAANDGPSQITALLAIEELIDKFSEAKFLEFAYMISRNPDENDNAVTLAHGRAVLAVGKRFPELIQAQAVTIEEILENVAELSCYGEDSWHDFRLLLCDTALKYQALPLEKIEPLLHLSFASPSLHRAWQKVKHSRQPEHQASSSSMVSLPFLICHGMERLGIDQFDKVQLSDPHFLEALLPLLDRDDLCGLEVLTDLLSRAPLKQALMPLQKRSLILSAQFRSVDSGSSLPPVLSSAIRALTRHIGLFPFANSDSLVEKCSSTPEEFLIELLGNSELAEPVLQELTCLSISSLEKSIAPILVETLVKIALGDRGWRRYTVAAWLSNNFSEALAETSISQVLEKYKIDQRKLKTWQK